MKQPKTSPKLPPAIRRADVAKNTVERLDAFLEKTGMKDSKVGMMALGDNKFIKRLRDGENFSMATADRLNDWMEKYLKDNHPKT